MPTRITSPESRNTGLRIQRKYGSYVNASRRGVKVDGMTYVGDLRKLEAKLGLQPDTLEGGEVLLRRRDGTVRVASSGKSGAKKRMRVKAGGAAMGGRRSKMTRMGATPG